MFWALLALYFFGGAAGSGVGILTESMIDHTAERVEVVVVDAKRVQKAVEALGVMKHELGIFNEKLIKSDQAMRVLYKDHSAGANRMLTNLKALDVDWELAQKNIIEQHFELKKSISKKEWVEIFTEK